MSKTLKKYIDAKGINLNDLARDVGYSKVLVKGLVNSWEVHISFEVLEEICNALGLSKATTIQVHSEYDRYFRKYIKFDMSGLSDSKKYLLSFLRSTIDELEDSDCERLVRVIRTARGL